MRLDGALLSVAAATSLLGTIAPSAAPSAANFGLVSACGRSLHAFTGLAFGLR